MSWLGDKLREIAEQIYDDTPADADLPPAYEELHDLADTVEEEETEKKTEEKKEEKAEEKKEEEKKEE